MATSLVAFRGRVFFVKDTPLQAAMYLLARELTERGASTPWLAGWRERLVRQARWGGGGLIIIGLDEYPPDEPAAPLAEVARGALERLPRDLTTDGLAEARVRMGDAYRWPSDWVYGDGHRVEDDPEFHEDVSIVLLAMLELITGEVPERYGSLVHDEGTPGVGSMMLPWWAVRHRYGPPPEAGPDEEDVITSGGPVRAGDDEAGAVRRRSHGFLRWLRMILGGGSDAEGGRR